MNNTHEEIENIAQPLLGYKQKVSSSNTEDGSFYFRTNNQHKLLSQHNADALIRAGYYVADISIIERGKGELSKSKKEYLVHVRKLSEIM